MEDESDYWETLQLFQQAFDIFNKKQLNYDELKEVFTTMEVPYSDEDFQQQFDDIDQD